MTLFDAPIPAGKPGAVPVYPYQRDAEQSAGRYVAYALGLAVVVGRQFMPQRLRSDLGDTFRYRGKRLMSRRVPD